MYRQETSVKSKESSVHVPLSKEEGKREKGEGIKFNGGILSFFLSFLYSSWNIVEIRHCVCRLC